MNFDLIKNILIVLVFAVLCYFHFRDALDQHEKFLHMSPAQQALQLETWHEQDEMETDRPEFDGYDM